MKTLLFLLLPVVCIGQTAPAKADLYQLVDFDTLGTSTTLTFELAAGIVPLDYTRVYEYSWVVTADSISGANAGTVALQFSNSANSDATPTWVTADTETIDGSAQQIFLFEGTVRSRRMRLLITSPSGTRVTIVNVEGCAKRSP